MDLALKKYKRLVGRINRLEGDYQRLGDSDLAHKTPLLRMRLKSGETLDKILPDAFALAREVARRVTGMRAYDVQLMGAIGAHEGKILEMKTGEGKTLTIALAAFLNALEGKGVHVVTANDYLAKRDAESMQGIYEALGLSANYITSQTSDFDRQVAYAADITYVTNNELGFDFLKDNMLYDPGNRRLRGFHYAIVDEADSVLIDEAQMPLVISDRKTTEEKDKVLYQKLNGMVAQLKKKIDFKVDHKEHTVTLTIEGIKKLEQLLGVDNLYQDSETDYIFFIEQLLKAHQLFQRDKDYVVDRGKVVIVDEFTGRLMPSHRYFQGIHQAIEAKEGLGIQDESRTLAAITFQQFFKKYRKFTGLTGTAATAKKEFRLIYGKQVVVIPTNVPISRQDFPDRFFLNWEDKLRYLVWSTKEYYYKKGAALIGTRSVQKSREAHLALLSENVPANVLNATNNLREAEVVAQAGQPGSVTVSTNMAGRGTDIEIADRVRELGGLMIYGMERHNSRRIDLQLVGRAGRQGDPGSSQFLVSADDELIKTYFKQEYLNQIANYSDVSQGVESTEMGKIIEKAQRRMENIFFDQRLLSYEFDKVLEGQRQSFYRQRDRVLNDDDLKQETLSLIQKEVYKLIVTYQASRKKSLTPQGVRELEEKLARMAVNEWFKSPFGEERLYSLQEARDLAYRAFVEFYEAVESYLGSRKMRLVEKTVTLKVLDLIWVEFLGKAEELQEAAMVASISQADFFTDYRVRMNNAYQAMLFSVPRVVCLTFFRTINKMIKVSQTAEGARNG
jgi:preprotein translocase subunit SecA